MGTVMFIIYVEVNWINEDMNEDDVTEKDAEKRVWLRKMTGYGDLW